MKILQWNVWFKESPKYIAEEIKKLDVDVICAQELIQNSRKGIDTAEEIAKLIGYNYFFKEADTWDNNDFKESQGNAIFSRLPIIKKTFKYVQEPKRNPPDASHEGRVYVEITVKVGDLLLDIGNIHLSYSHRFEITPYRKKEVDNLIAIISQKKSRFLLCGDFNSSQDSYTVKQVSKYLSNVGPDFKQKSWTTKPFEYQGFKEDGLNWRLDYVYKTKDIKVISSEIVKTPFSDHLPILVKIEP